MNLGGVRSDDEV